MEATKDQARTAAEEMTTIKKSNCDMGFDEGVQAFMCTVATKLLDWDMSYLGEDLSVQVDKRCDQWRASLPQSDERPTPPFVELPAPPSGTRTLSGELPMIPHPLEVHHE